MDIRKIIIILVIGALFAFFVNALVEAVHQSPDYDDYCEEFNRPYQLEEEDVDDAAWQQCQDDYESANDKHNLVVFYVSIIFGMIAIIVGLMLPTHKEDLNQWIGSGFMLGGFFTLFVGTIRAYGALDRIVRPIILLIELLIVIYVSYRKIGKK
jgi:hypothetical protein